MSTHNGTWRGFDEIARKSGRPRGLRTKAEQSPPAGASPPLFQASCPHTHRYAPFFVPLGSFHPFPLHKQLVSITPFGL